MKTHLPPILLFLSFCCLLTAACNPYGHTSAKADLRPIDSVVIAGTPEDPDTIHYASTRATLGLPVVWYGVQRTDSGWVVSGDRWEDDSLGEPLGYLSHIWFEWEDNVLTMTESGGLNVTFADTVVSIACLKSGVYQLEIHPYSLEPTTARSILIEDKQVARGIWTWTERGEASYYVQDRSVENYPLVCSIVWHGEARND